MPHRHHRPAHTEPHVMSLALEDLEWVEADADAAVTEVRAKSSAVRRHRGGFPPAISDAELARLVDECAAELCTPRFFEAYVY